MNPKKCFFKRLYTRHLSPIFFESFFSFFLAPKTKKRTIWALKFWWVGLIEQKWGQLKKTTSAIHKTSKYWYPKNLHEKMNLLMLFKASFSQWGAPRMCKKTSQEREVIFFLSWKGTSAEKEPHLPKPPFKKRKAFKKMPGKVHSWYWFLTWQYLTMNFRWSTKCLQTSWIFPRSTAAGFYPTTAAICAPDFSFLMVRVVIYIRHTERKGKQRNQHRMHTAYYLILNHDFLYNIHTHPSW